ncbi:MAG: ABC transporter permease [Bacilli bacterium]
MILNVINKNLNEGEKKLLKELSTGTKVVNFDYGSKNQDIKIHLRDIVDDEREILIVANDSSKVIFWGYPIDEYDKKVYHSLLERENVYFVAVDEDGRLYYDNIKRQIPEMFSKLISKYLVLNKKCEREFLVSEVLIENNIKKNSAVESVKEITNNRHMIWKMASSIFQQETLKTTLGSYWHIVRDIVFFITYVMFMIFMRGFGEIEGIPVVMYLVSGLVAWYYMSDIIGGGVACIRNSRAIISKVKFPITIIPLYHSLAIFYRRGLTYIILVAVVAMHLIANARGVEVHPLKFIYYTISMVIFMTGFNILVSAFVAISRDFYELYKSFSRIQMYFNPIFWDMTSVQNKLANSGNAIISFMEIPFKILMLNPTVYILTGYRESFGALRTNDVLSTSVFWVIVVIMYLVGFKLQMRVRSLYADII